MQWLYILDGISAEKKTQTQEWRQQKQKLDINLPMKRMSNLKSFHAISRAASPQTIRVKCVLGQQPMMVLINSRSTHNFVAPAVARKPGLTVQQGENIQVMVKQMEINCLVLGYCKKVKLSIQGISIFTDFFLLALEGCEVVLGAHWLWTLGPFQYLDVVYSEWEGMPTGGRAHQQSLYP